MLKYTTQEIIEKFKLIHNDKYDYSKFEYLGNRVKSIIICKKHGEFLQHSNAHCSGQGCKQCFFEKNTLHFISQGWKANYNKTKETFVQKCIEKNSSLDFSKTKYLGKKNKVIVTCPIHGDYYTTPRLLLAGVNCKKCFNESLREKWTKKGWINYCTTNNIDNCIFYLIEVINSSEHFLKFGITSKTLKTRINKYPSQYKISIIYEIESTPEKIWSIEDYIKRNYKQFKYKPILKFGGSKQECLNFEALKQILNDKTMCSI